MVILFFSFGDFTNNYLQIYIQKYLKCRSHFINTDWESDATDGDDALMHWWITWHFWLMLNLDSKGGGVYGSTHGLFLRFAGVQMRIELHKTRFSAWKILLKGGGKFSFGNQAYWRSAPCTSKGKSLWCKMEILKSFILPSS